MDRLYLHNLCKKTRKKSLFLQALHKLIAETDDIDVLTKVQAYFSSLSHENIDWWDYLNDDEKKNIQTGINQLNNGNGISNDDVKLKVDKLMGRA